MYPDRERDTITLADKVTHLDTVRETTMLQNTVTLTDKVTLTVTLSETVTARSRYGTVETRKSCKLGIIIVYNSCTIQYHLFSCLNIYVLISDLRNLIKRKI